MTARWTGLAAALLAAALMSGCDTMTPDEFRIEVYCASFRPMQTAFLGQPHRVLFKLVVDAETRRVLGCHIVAPGAGELIQLAAVAIRMGATKEDFDRTVAVHPTMAEEIVTLRAPVRRA